MKIETDPIVRAMAGLGCICQHERVAWNGPHCDGPLFSSARGYCWSCAFIRHCQDEPAE